MNKQVIAITGAAGNLGGKLAESMVNDSISLHLLWHKKNVDAVLAGKANVKTYRVDLADKATLADALAGVDTIVHFAGVLFHGKPEKFLPTTNLHYFANLLDSALKAGVRRMILISFPHVEGETSPGCPATDRLDGNPDSVHAMTRLEEERLLMAQTGIEKVILRCGMVYGRGILMIDAARWFSRYGLLGIWRQPNTIHLISTDDFTAAVKASVYNPAANGIYPIGDDGVQTLAEFLDTATSYWQTCRPWRMPLWMIYTAAWIFERISLLTGCKSPLTRDFITIGRVSYYGDTSRMKSDLLPELKYPTFRDGINTL